MQQRKEKVWMKPPHDPEFRAKPDKPEAQLPKIVLIGQPPAGDRIAEKLLGLCHLKYHRGDPGGVTIEQGTDYVLALMVGGHGAAIKEKARKAGALFMPIPPSWSQTMMVLERNGVLQRFTSGVINLRLHEASLTYRPLAEALKPMAALLKPPPPVPEKPRGGDQPDPRPRYVSKPEPPPPPPKDVRQVEMFKKENAVPEEKPEMAPFSPGPVEAAVKAAEQRAQQEPPKESPPKDEQKVTSGGRGNPPKWDITGRPGIDVAARNQTFIEQRERLIVARQAEAEKGYRLMVQFIREIKGDVTNDEMGELFKKSGLPFPSKDYIRAREEAGVPLRKSLNRNPKRGRAAELLNTWKELLLTTPEADRPRHILDLSSLNAPPPTVTPPEPQKEPEVVKSPIVREAEASVRLDKDPRYGTQSFPDLRDVPSEALVAELNRRKKEALAILDALKYQG